MNGFLDLKASKIFKQFIVYAEELLSKEGYNFIKLPILDTLDNQIKTAKDFKELLSVRTSNDILVLRKDMTYQLAGYVASLKERVLPMKIYYEGDIFSWKDNIKVEYQLGIEYIGYKDKEGLLEPIKILFHLLKFFDEDISLCITDTSVVNKIINGYQNKNEVYKALYLKNIALLKEYHLDWVLSEDILFLEQKLKTLNIDASTLLELYNDLKQYIDVKIDLSEIKELPYYEGITFGFYSKKYPFMLASGGEYNILKSVYNVDLKACGGAIYLSDILELS